MAIQPNPLLSGGAVAAIDRLLGRLRAAHCVVERPSGARDAGGAPTGAVAVIGAAACRVRVPGRQPIEAVQGGRFGPQADYEVVFDRAVAVTLDLRSDDRIQVDGTTLQIIAVPRAVTHGFQLVVPCRAAS